MFYSLFKMILRPVLQDIKNIGYYLGKVILGLGMTFILPLVVAVVFKEKNPTLDFLISFSVTMLFGYLLSLICYSEEDLTWMQGMIVVSLAWGAASLFGALPLFLSGHWHSFLDAVFDSMSGFATTGLSLAQGMDKLSYAHNFWRHLIMFIGGQGIAIVALSFLVKGISGAFKMYVGEARDEKVLPNVIGTARFIWLVSIVYLVLGTLAIGFVGILEGIKPVNAFFHGACLFMAAFDTGGFAPQSQNILYYHSFSIEVITIVIMFLGAINFKLHYYVWTGNWREVYRNIEMRVLTITILAVFGISCAGLFKDASYPSAIMLFRKGFYQIISGHTGTGFMTIYPAQFKAQWNDLALTGLVLAMMLGGAICSTTGGIKILRVGIIFKALWQDIKRIIVPERAVIMQKVHHIKDLFLEDKQVRSVFLITVSYLALYFLGSLIAMFYGYGFLESLFESASAAANVGLSCGITSVDMPAGLKITYILQMWAGRLEFMSIFALLGFIWAALKGKS
ncbi:MAG: TrkH family potassium uptake protein [Candidatus Omnitrophica bacterium]|jgi:trk system potassium uptake protein TrkH|nr:TrkH family potassium uptake protein [Candidatus Omnitrophota bacterium]